MGLGDGGGKGGKEGVLEREKGEELQAPNLPWGIQKLHF